MDADSDMHYLYISLQLFAEFLRDEPTSPHTLVLKPSFIVYPMSQNNPGMACFGEECVVANRTLGKPLHEVFGEMQRQTMLFKANGLMYARYLVLFASQCIFGSGVSRPMQQCTAEVERIYSLRYGRDLQAQVFKNVTDGTLHTLIKANEYNTARAKIGQNKNHKVVINGVEIHVCI